MLRSEAEDLQRLGAFEDRGGGVEGLSLVAGCGCRLDEAGVGDVHVVVGRPPKPGLTERSASGCGVVSDVVAVTLVAVGNGPGFWESA